MTALTPVKNRAASEQRELLLLPHVIRRVPLHRRTLAIDGGANVGRWAVALAAFFRKVLAFEPVDQTYGELRRRVSAHPDIVALQCALMDCRGFVRMTHPAKRSASTAYFAEPCAAGISAITIDSLDVRDCGLIKLDLEGAELRALHGARGTLKRCQPMLIVECVPKQLKRYGDSPGDLDDFMHQAGYELVGEQLPNKVYAPC